MLEICIDSIESAIKAENAGADRLELCENLLQGGVTPSLGKITSVVQSVSIPVRVLIRPRAGNFQYSDAELNLIYQDIELVSSTEAEGIVVGALNHDASISEEFLKRCNSASNQKTLVFHRAFDVCEEAENSVKLLVKHGFDTILTSGQKNTVVEGVNLLETLQRKYGSDINFLAGGGVRASNLQMIHEKTGIKQFHSSAKIPVNTSMEVSMSSSSVAERTFTIDTKEILKMKTLTKLMQ